LSVFIGKQFSMKLSRILQLIKEELENWFDDEPSMADKYYEKNVMPQPTMPKSDVPIDAELVGYVDKSWTQQLKTPIPVYKNPKNLNGFGTEARGVLLNNGEFYLSISASAMHDNILDMLAEKGILPLGKTHYYATMYPEEFVAVQRNFNTNTFSQSSAYDEFPPYYEEIFRLASQKHPYKFKAFNLSEEEEIVKAFDLSEVIDPNNIQSNIPAGYDAKILYEIIKDESIKLGDLP
jgi:hypothetical protein